MPLLRNTADASSARPSPDTQTIIRTRPLEADVLAEVLAAAYAAHPERFVRKGPGAGVAAGGRVDQPADREEVMSAQ